MNRWVKLILICVLSIAAAFGVRLYISGSKAFSVSYSTIIDKAQSGQVTNVTIVGTTMTGHYTDGTLFRTTIPANYNSLLDVLNSQGVNITIKDQNSSAWLSALINLAPLILLLLFWPAYLGILLFLVFRIYRNTSPKKPY
jgi:cell division protease FtsH